MGTDVGVSRTQLLPILRHLSLDKGDVLRAVNESQIIIGGAAHVKPGKCL
jgi:hypothetical protein